MDVDVAPAIETHDRCIVATPSAERAQRKCRDFCLLTLEPFVESGEVKKGDAECLRFGTVG